MENLNEFDERLENDQEDGMQFEESEMELLERLMNEADFLQSEGIRQKQLYEQSNLIQIENETDRTISKVRTVIETFKNSQQQHTDDIDFSIENTILQQALYSKKLEQEKLTLQEQLRDKTGTIRALMEKVQSLESQLVEQKVINQDLESQIQSANKNLTSFKSKYEDERRERIIQEALKVPKQKQLLPSNIRPGLLEQPNYQENIVSDPHDFWYQGQEKMEYPGKPKKLYDIINPNSVWVNNAQEQEIQIGNIKKDVKKPIW